MNERRLRESYDRLLALRAAANPDRDQCPSPEALAAVVDLEGPEADRLAVLDHVMGCPFCHSEFEMLRVASRATGQWPRPPAGGAALRGLLLIAAVGLAGLAWAGCRDRAGLRLRQPDRDARVAAPIRLAWSPVAGARSYLVGVAADPGRNVVSAALADTFLIIPPHAALIEGRPYQWSVAALTESGDTLRSESRSFTVQGAPSP